MHYMGTHVAFQLVFSWFMCPACLFSVCIRTCLSQGVCVRVPYKGGNAPPRLLEDPPFGTAPPPRRRHRHCHRRPRHHGARQAGRPHRRRCRRNKSTMANVRRPRSSAAAGLTAGLGFRRVRADRAAAAGRDRAAARGAAAGAAFLLGRARRAALDDADRRRRRGGVAARAAARAAAACGVGPERQSERPADDRRVGRAVHLRAGRLRRQPGRSSAALGASVGVRPPAAWEKPHASRTPPARLWGLWPPSLWAAQACGGAVAPSFSPRQSVVADSHLDAATTQAPAKAASAANVCTRRGSRARRRATSCWCARAT